MSKLFSLLLGIFITFTIQGQNNLVNLSGRAPDYAGNTIELYQISDPISGKKTVVANFKIKNDGSFNTQVEVSEICFCQADFDVWRAQIYLEPGQSYQLIFPPLRKISEVERRNPFFTPEVVPFGLQNAPENDINRLIQSVEQVYAKEENHFFNQIYRNKSQAAVDSLKNRLLLLFPISGNKYFEDYKFYRVASAEYAMHQGRNETFIETYFVKKIPNLHMPPCYQLFDQLFKNYFTILGNAIDGKDFRRLVGQADLNRVDNYLISQKGWNKKLSHLVILKSIQDAFYQKQFPQNSLINLLEKISQSDWEKEDKQTAIQLKYKLTYLLPGTIAPPISIAGFDGKNHQLSAIKGKYIYLHFTSIKNPVCRQHLDDLKKNFANFSGQIDIINLIPESETSKKDLILQQNWPGQFFTVTAVEADKYRVKSFPTAYLISPNGKLELSPALNPLDGFDRQFNGILKQKRMEEMRNQPK